jgi:hypothetical protein
MPRLFVMIRTRGPAWQESRSMESQADWASHASFMNALTKEGFVILGGPLEGTPDVLLVMRAESPGELRSRLAQDPWAGQDLLRITRVAPWTLRLDPSSSTGMDDAFLEADAATRFKSLALAGTVLALILLARLTSPAAPNAGAGPDQDPSRRPRAVECDPDICRGRGLDGAGSGPHLCVLLALSPGG